MQNIYKFNFEKQIVLGVGLPIFIKSNNEYYSTVLKIYEDQIIEIWGENLNFEGFVEKVKAGLIVTKIPEGVNLNHQGLFLGESKVLSFYVEEDEFIKEVQDNLNVFKGLKCFSELCFLAFTNFITRPSEIHQYALKKAYENVPVHKRMFLGSMEDKDIYVKTFINTELDKIEQRDLEYCKNLYLDRKLTLLK
jgi:hypothetical protein